MGRCASVCPNGTSAFQGARFATEGLREGDVLSDGVADAENDVLELAEREGLPEGEVDSDGAVFVEGLVVGLVVGLHEMLGLIDEEGLGAGGTTLRFPFRLYLCRGRHQRAPTEPRLLLVLLAHLGVRREFGLLDKLRGKMHQMR